MLSWIALDRLAAKAGWQSCTAVTLARELSNESHATVGTKGKTNTLLSMESLAGKQIHFCFNNKFPLTAALPLIFFTVSQIERTAKGRRRPTVLRATAANYLKQRIYGQLAKKLLNQFFECCLNGRWLHSSNWFRMHTHPVEKPGAARNVWHFCCQCACTLAFFAIFRSPSHPSMHEFSRNLIA